jgi:uncharacterized protein (TIGR03083 family)
MPRIWSNIRERVAPVDDLSILVRSITFKNCEELMSRPGPILVADRFPKLRLGLIDVLSGLSSEEWASPTVAPHWSVKDIGLHLLGGDLGILSRPRDGFNAGGQPIRHHDDLVALVNRLNDEWVTATRRLSPRVLCELLSFTGPLVEAYFASLDPFDIGQPVSWAGPHPAPVWFDIAREFTERWHHQQQIRDAAGRQALYDPYFLAPVLDTFMRALPYSFRDTTAAAGTVIKIQISGEGGGSWFLQHQPSGWELLLETGTSPATTILVTQDLAWRLFTKGIDGERARSKSTITGEGRLALPLFTTVTVIA